MMTDRYRNPHLSRRALLQAALAAGGFVGLAGASPAVTFARQATQDTSNRTNPSSALRLSRILNRTKYGDLPPAAIEHAKIIIASTLASAASGSLIPSARIIREL